MKRAFVSTSPLFSLFSGCELGGLRNPWSVTRELRRVRPGQPAPSESKKVGGKREERRAVEKQREAVSNKDAGEQSAVSQMWGGKRDERGRRESTNSRYQDEVQKFKTAFSSSSSSLGLQKGQQNLVKIAFCSSGSSAVGHLSGLLEKNYRNHNSTRRMEV